MHKRILLAGNILLTSVVMAGLPSIDNRSPRLDEIGYRPLDGSVSYFNPPSLTWLHETRAKTYEVQWSRENAQPMLVTNLAFNTYTHFETLEPGGYQWQYRYRTEQGEISNWSQVRKFTVIANAVPFPLPTRAQQRERIPVGHPRLFLRPEDLPKLRAIATGKSNQVAATRFRKIVNEADQLLNAPIPAEPTVRGSIRDPKTRDAWWPNRTRTEQACMEAETLAFVYLLTGEAKYGKAARERISALAKWDPDGPTNFRLNCEAAKPMLFRLPRAYDWGYAALTPEDRQAVRNTMHRRALDAWNSGEVGQGTGHLNKPFSSHGNRTFHKLGECAIAFLGDIPEAETWIDYALNKFYAAYPVWSDDEGGWHEGVSYWAGYLGKMPWWLETMRTSLQIDGFQKPFFAHFGDYPLYVTPPGSPNSGFGDLAYRPPSAGTGRMLEYYTRSMSGRASGASAGYWQWWGEAWKMDEADGIMGFLWAANLPQRPLAKAPVDLPSSKAFHGIGVASLHVTITNSANDVHLLFKSSPFGSQSHGHNPQNSFQLNAYGDALLTACVYRDWHGSDFHYQWVHSTRAQNGVLVDGHGQVPHTAMLKGSLIDFSTSPELDYVIGSAAESYGGRLERFRRSVAFVKPDLLILFDDLVATNVATFQFMSHALQGFKVEEKAKVISTSQKRAGVEVAYLHPGEMKFRQWDGFEPPPEKEFPNQWHVEAGTTAPARELQMISVLMPYRTGQKKTWTLKRLENTQALGVRCESDGEKFVVAFRKANQPGTVALESYTFDRPVALFRVR